MLKKNFFLIFLKNNIVTNTSSPTMEVFKAADSINTGTAVIIAPGGGMFFQSINTEGRGVAKWLNSKGITTFVLKYRLVPTDDNGGKEVMETMQKDYEGFIDRVSQVMPFAIRDGLNAVEYVRAHATEYNVSINKIGFLGFSAGGSVGLGVSYYFKKENRPDFFATLYPGTTLIPTQTPKKEAPPLFIVAAEDDFLGLAPGAIGIYSDWFKMGLKAEFHMYSRGGHGFGMTKQNLPTDKWIERFYEWAIAEGFVAIKK